GRAEQPRRATVLVTTPPLSWLSLDTASDLGRTYCSPCAVMPVVGLPVAMPRSSFGRDGPGCWGSGRPSRERWNNLAARAVRAKQWPQRSPGPLRSVGVSPPAGTRAGMRGTPTPLCSTLGTRRYTPRPPRPREPAGKRGAAGSVPSSLRLAEMNCIARRRLQHGGARARRGLPRRGRARRRGPGGRRPRRGHRGRGRGGGGGGGGGRVRRGGRRGAG